MHMFKYICLKSKTLKFSNLCRCGIQVKPKRFKILIFIRTIRFLKANNIAFFEDMSDFALGYSYSHKKERLILSKHGSENSTQGMFKRNFGFQRTQKVMQKKEEKKKKKKMLKWNSKNCSVCESSNTSQKTPGYWNVKRIRTACGFYTSRQPSFKVFQKLLTDTQKVQTFNFSIFFFIPKIIMQNLPTFSLR